MRLPFLLLPLALLLFGGPVLLRYKFKPGTVMHFSLSDTLIRKMKAGNQAEQVELRQTSSSEIKRTISSGSNGTGITAEVPTRGTIVLETPTGKETQVVPTITRASAMDGRGRVTNIRRHAAGSDKDLGAQVFDGLVFALPERPVAPGATWADAISVVGLDAEHTKMPVKVSSRYVGDETRAGHPCAHVEATVSSTFKIPGKTQSLDGKMSGKVHYWLAKDIGQDVETHADIKIELTPVTTGAPADRITRTIEFTTQQKLTK